LILPSNFSFKKNYF